MKIAFLSDGIPPYVIGGMQKHSLSLASQLVRFGHDVDLYHCVYTDNELPTEEDVNNLAFNGNLRFNKVHCSYFPTSIYFPGHYIWNSYRYSRHIYDNLVKDLNSYDFVYAKGFSAWKLFIKTNKKKNHPKIGLKFHGYEMFQSAPSIKVKIQHYLLRPFVKWQNRQADFIFSYGGKISEIIKSLNITENKIIEIPSSINEKWIISNLTQKGSKLKFLFIGRYERRKGIEELNDAIDSLSDRKITAEFHFVGNIPKDKQLKSKNLDIYRKNRQIIIDGLQKIGLQSFAPPDGAFYFYIDISQFSDNSLSFCNEILEEVGVAITPGVDFDPMRGKTTIRISYARSTEEITEGISRLGQFMQKRGYC